MNLLILSTKLPYPPKDGGAIATLNLATGLARNGFKVSMLVINTKKHYFNPNHIPKHLNDIINFHSVYRDTTPQPLNALKNLLFSNTPYIAERFVFNEFKTALIDLLQKEDFQFVQMEGPYFAPYLKIIRQNSNAKISLRAHNVEHRIWEQRLKSERNPLQRSYLSNMTKRIKNLEFSLMYQADFVVPISPEDESYFRQILPNLNTLTIPTGINIDDYHPKKSITSKSIFFIGSLDWLPNQEGLQWFIDKVMPLIINQHPDISFHVAGRNAPEEFLKKLSANPSIVYHGEVDDARTFMERYGIMAVPLLTGSGIRIKIIEGMAMGKCIVTTSLGAAGIPVKNGKHILLANDKKRFASNISLLIENHEKTTSISKNARELIREKFDTFALANSLKEAYKKLV